MISMHSTRLQILQAINRYGEATVKELAEAVGVKAITVRHHLTGLRADQLVEHDTQHKGVGRPLHIFRLTTAGLPYVEEPSELV